MLKDYVVEHVSTEGVRTCLYAGGLADCCEWLTQNHKDSLDHKEMYIITPRIF